MHSSREIRGYGGTPKDREFTDKETRRYRHGYYAAISFLDAQVGEVLDALDESGMAEETVVVFTSDHGFHIGEQALWGKTSNFELDARVPLIIASPLKRHAPSVGQRTGALAELVDLYPTLSEVAGLKPIELPENLEGKSLVPVLRDPLAKVKDAAFTQHQQPFYGSRENWEAWGYSLRTERWRYTEWRAIDGGEVVAQELYDHNNDPLETENVAGDEANAALLKKLSKRLKEGFSL